LTWRGESNGCARWSPDGRWIAFVSDRTGGAPKGSGLFVLPAADPGEPREITRHPGGIAGLAWSPDGRTIAYTARYDPDNPDDTPVVDGATPKVRVTSRIDYKRDGPGYMGDVREHLFVVDVASGTRRRLTDELHRHQDPAWSPEGCWIAVGMDNWAIEHRVLLLIDPDNGTRRTIALPSGEINTWAWSPAGDRIALTGEEQPLAGQSDWYLYRLASDELTRLTDDLICLPDWGPPVWLDDRIVLFSGDREGMSRLYHLDVTAGEVREIVHSPAVRGSISIDAARRFVVQEHQSFDALGEITVTDLSSGTDQVVTGHNTALLNAHPRADWERLTFRRGDFTIEAWLLLPPTYSAAKRYPLVLDIHGGPQGHFGHEFNLLQQMLASHGFAVLAVNPRGSTSYGRAFSSQVNSDWGGEDALDLLAALDLVVKRKNIDPERIGMSGYSYGGYMTAWLLGQTDRFNACVCGAPVFDLETEYGTGAIDYAGCEWEWGGRPHLRREFYTERSPSTWAHRATTPTLIVQGEADEICPVGQSEYMFTILKQAGCEVELARYPGGSHGFPRDGPPAHREDYLARTLAWFQRHLAGEGTG
jgi:dipeptidyl aminopeptidase/acylaminoacyl peptidase